MRVKAKGEKEWRRKAQPAWCCSPVMASNHAGQKTTTWWPSQRCGSAPDDTTSVPDRLRFMGFGVGLGACDARTTVAPAPGAGSGGTGGIFAGEALLVTFAAGACDDGELLLRRARDVAKSSSMLDRMATRIEHRWPSLIRRQSVAAKQFFSSFLHASFFFFFLVPQTHNKDERIITGKKRNGLHRNQF